MVIRQLVGILETLKMAVNKNNTTGNKKRCFGEGQTFASSPSASASFL
jgi:hypothetical protein